MKRSEILRQATFSKIQSLLKRARILRKSSREAVGRLEDIKRQSDELLRGQQGDDDSGRARGK